MKRRFLMVLLVACSALRAGEWEWGGEVAVELRAFAQEPAHEAQFEHLQPSLTLQGDLRWYSESGDQQFIFVPYARLDGQDAERTHADLREAYFRSIGDSHEVLIGAAKVFWGVTESRHLVDVINQTDAVEDIDEEDKLGQPMVMLSLFRDWGKIDVFVLPYFRERPFPGRDGRLRTQPRVATSGARYEDGDEAWNTDIAVRYSHFIGPVDIGLSLFAGTSREPLLVLDTSGTEPVLRPFYQQIVQLGIDAQYTADAWLWKFEGLVRDGQGGVFGAVVAGFEYTFYGVTDAGADLGLLVELLYDGRSEHEAPPTTLDNDVFYGVRYALNDVQDTSLLAGLITDIEDASTSATLEAERRIGNDWKAELEARFFINAQEDNLLQAFERDSFLTLRLTCYF